MRCKSCNVKLLLCEMKWNPETKRFNDMCNVCKFHSKSEYNILTDKEYSHGGLHEGMTAKKQVPY